MTVEMVPWCDGKNQLTTTYRWFLSTWAKRLSWSEVAAIFRTSWDSVCRAVEHAVEWGLLHRDLSQLTSLGVDEIAWACGHRYLALVYDIGGEGRRLLAVAEERTEASLRECLEGLGETACKRVCYVCSDMWKPYLNVIAEKLGQAVHVLDRFHAMQQFGKALDEIRAGEAVTAGADEEGCPHDPGSSAVDPELVSGTRRGLGGCGGGAQQQGETGDEKIVWFPNTGSRETGSPAQSWRSP